MLFFLETFQYLQKLFLRALVIHIFLSLPQYRKYPFTLNNTVPCLQAHQINCGLPPLSALEDLIPLNKINTREAYFNGLF